MLVSQLKPRDIPRLRPARPSLLVLRPALEACGCRFQSPQCFARCCPTASSSGQKTGYRFLPLMSNVRPHQNSMSASTITATFGLHRAPSEWPCSVRSASGVCACCENRGSMNQRINRVARSVSACSGALGGARRHEAASRSGSLRAPAAQPYQDHAPPALNFRQARNPNGALRVRPNRFIERTKNGVPFFAAHVGR